MKKLGFAWLVTLFTLFFLTAGVLAGERIKIGAIFSVTGGQASIDTPGLKGARLAVKEINAKGGVLGSDIELIHIDGRTEIGAVKDAMSRLVNEYKVAAVIGIVASIYRIRESRMKIKGQNQGQKGITCWLFDRVDQGNWINSNRGS